MSVVHKADLILAREALRTEIHIALFRILAVGLFAMVDMATFLLGQQMPGYSMTGFLPALDLAYLAMAIGLAVYLRGGGILPESSKFYIITADYLYASAYLAIADIYGLMDPDMTVGMAASIALILAMVCGLRFSVAATVYASVAGAALVAVAAVWAGSTLVMAVSGVGMAALAGAVVSFMSSRHLQTIRYIVERGKFERFLPSQVVDTVIKGEGDLEMGGKELEVTVLFSDIRGFTAMCETMRPMETLTLLNDYFSAVSAVVFKHGGMLDKFIGDAVMAVFGAPGSRHDDARRALLCALDIHEVVRKMNEERGKDNLRQIKLGIGLHTGVVVAGTLGSPDRMDYTVIGDTVNVAARVESTTRNTGAEILLTSATVRAAGEGFKFNPVGKMSLKGREEPVDIFSIDPCRSDNISSEVDQHT